MSEQLKASFQIDFNVGSLEPLQRIEQILKNIDANLARIGQVVSPLERVSQATSQAGSSIGQMNERLEKTASIAHEAGSGMAAMGSQAEAGAEKSVSAINRVQSALNRVKESSVGGYASRVGGSVRNFGGAVQSGIGSAFGAAAAGFGILSPIHAAAEYDNDLTHVGIGLDLHGNENARYTAQLGQKIDALARATGQRSTELVSAAAFFNREGYNNERMQAVLPQVAQISTAYNAQPAAVARTTFALQENMGVGDAGLSGALASLAIAGKQADLPFEKLAPLFPEVAAAAGQLGVKGRSGVNELAAMLAVMRKSTGTEGEAATDTRAFIQAITSPHTAKRFAAYDVDMFGEEEAARKSGQNPMERILQIVDKLTNHGQDREILGSLFNNQQDRAFVQAQLAHQDQYQQIKQKTSAANPDVIKRDFDTGQKSTLIQLQAFEDTLGQLQRRIGSGFVPIMAVMTAGLHKVIEGFDWLNKHIPGSTTVIITLIGGLLALSVVMGAIGAIAIPAMAAFSLIGTVLGGISLATVGVVAAVAAVGVAIVAAGVVIYRNWGTIKKYIVEFGQWALSWAKWFGSVFSNAFSAVFNGISNLVKNAFQGIENFGASIAGKMGSLFHTGSPALAAAGQPGQNGTVKLHITHEPGLNVRPVGKPNTPVTIDKGRMVGLP